MAGKYYDIKNEALLDRCPPGIDSTEWDDFRERYGRAADFEENGHPVQIDFELNGGCNMSCPFCLHGHEKIPNKLICFDEFKRVIDEAVEFGVRGLKLSYINEPMLRKDLERFIEYARSAGILNIYLVTNGTLLTSKRRESMMLSGITKIFVSIDAVTAETYNKQRLSGKFDLVVNNVLSFIEERNARGLSYPLMRVSFLRNALNEHEEDRFFEYWKDRVDMISFQRMNDLPDKDSGLTLGKYDSNGTPGCTFPWKQLVIDHSGDILPCCKMGGRKLAVGNIKEMTLKEAWDSDQMKSLRQLHKENRWRENPVCNRCITTMGL